MATEESKDIFCLGEIMREEKVSVGDLSLPRGTPSPCGRKGSYAGDSCVKGEG